MSLFPSYGVPISPVALEVQTRDLFDCDFIHVQPHVDDGTFRTPEGHVGTFSRGATLASVSDAQTVPSTQTYTALEAQPAFEQRDWDNDGVREAFGLRMGTSDRLAFASSLRPMSMAGMLEMIETGARTSVNSTLWALRNDGATGAGLWLDTSGSFYRLSYNDGSTTRVATLASGAPASGDRVRFLWELSSTGVITLYQSINGAAYTSATAAALTLPASWAASASIRLNARGTGGSANAAQGWYRRCRLVAGALNQTTILERR